LGCRNAPGTASHATQPPSIRSGSGDPAAVIEYRGQSIRLTKRYDDYDEYKNDPNNIAPTEYARVQALLKDTPAPARCADFKEVLTVASDLSFPGYGTTSFGLRNTDGGQTFMAQAIEIPHADADRYLVYVSDGSGYRLADDVVLPERPFVRDIDLRDGAIVYLDGAQHAVAKRPIR
jgi:hypothetical protein